MGLGMGHGGGDHLLTVSPSLSSPSPFISSPLSPSGVSALSSLSGPSSLAAEGEGEEENSGFGLRFVSDIATGAQNQNQSVAEGQGVGMPGSMSYYSLFSSPPGVWQSKDGL